MKKILFCLLSATMLLAGCKEKNKPSEPELEETREVSLPGRFSVSAETQVQFSQGNLQYHAHAGVWRFAAYQYDIIGKNNVNISSTYDGWIDLFGWGTGDKPTQSNTDNSNYYTFTDWGVNAISNGGKKANTWRTLSKDEWQYILCSRTNAEALFGLGGVNGIYGAILLPDNWVLPEGASFVPGTDKGLSWDEENNGYYDIKGHYFSSNSYSVEQWEQMEAAGAVFLPAAGGRNWNKVNDISARGFYWSTKSCGMSAAYHLSFHDVGISSSGHDDRCIGLSVRLVR